jgi:uncharacterized protein (DUF2384 family)
MRQAERESIARVKRALRLIQCSIEVLGSTPAAYHWLTMPCAALRGKAPRDIHYDVFGARRVRPPSDDEQCVSVRCDRLVKNPL